MQSALNSRVDLQLNSTKLDSISGSDSYIEPINSSKLRLGTELNVREAISLKKFSQDLSLDKN